jgi:hypothetical protein
MTSNEPDPAIKALYRNAYRLTCYRRGRFLGDPDFAALDAIEKVRRLAGLIAVELGADPTVRDAIQRGVEDAMAGHLMPED